MNSSYQINSINRKFCSKTDQNVFDYIEMCKDCQEVPIPCYRSIEDEEGNFFCRNCFEKRSFDKKSIIQPSKREIKELDNLVICCKFFEKGFLNQFAFKNLVILIDHQKTCLYSKSEDIYKVHPSQPKWHVLFVNQKS